jgi:hypothetical protein
MAYCTDWHANVKKLYVDDGLTLEQIGALFGKTRERVRQVLQEEGIERRSATAAQKLHWEPIATKAKEAEERRRRKRARWVDLASDYAAGGSLAIVAQAHDVHIVTVRRALQKNGVTPRGHGRTPGIHTDPLDWSGLDSGSVVLNAKELGRVPEILRLSGMGAAKRRGLRVSTSVDGDMVSFTVIGTRQTSP